MSKLVKIYKHGEPKIDILDDHLDAHKLLGWQECEADEDEDEDAKPAKKPAKHIKEPAE